MKKKGDKPENNKSADALRKRAEVVIRKRVGEVEPSKLSVEEARRLVHELQVHQVELEMQNEELRLSQSMLEESRQKYSDLYDFAPVGYFTMDKDGMILEVNLTGAALLGVERASLIKKPFTVFVARDFQDAFYLHRKKVLDTGERQTCELRLKRKDGSEFHAEFESIFAEDKTIRTALSDITERKRAEEELLVKEKAIASSINGIVMADLEGNVTYVNDSFLGLMGYESSDEVLGKPGVSLAKDEKEGRKVLEALGQKGYWEGEIEGIRKDGALIIARVSAHTVLDSVGEPLCIMASFEDITERKKAEEELARLASYPELNPYPVIEVDNAGKILYQNPAAKELLGTKKSGSHSFLAGIVALPDLDGEKANIVREVKINDYWYVQAIHKVPESDRIRIYARDITDRKNAEDELNQYRQNLERMVEVRASELMEVNRRLRKEIENREKMEDEMLKSQKLESVGILAGGIAHDFNNALTAIMNNVSAAKMLLKSREKSDKAAETLDAALNTVRRTTKLAYQLLTFAEGGEPVRKVAYVRNLIADTAEFSLRGSNVKCELQFSDDLWPAYIDEGQIVQVVSNLVINADQSMPEGGTMEVSAENVSVKVDDPLPLEADKYIKLTVRDHGAGIHKKHLQKIFDPYFTTKEGGSGLGLASAYSIVKKHGGLITVESKVGSGATFYVYLPASDEKVIKEENIEDSKFRGAKILLMDDEEDVRDSVASALTLHGFEPEIAEDGSRAVKAYKEARKSGNPFDAVVMDLTVRGGMGGIEAVSEIQKMDPDVKAIVISGYSNDPVMADYKNYGFVGALKKPFEIEELSRILQEAIANKS